MLPGSAGHFLANLASGMPARCATLAPLVVLCDEDDVDMR